MKKRSTDKGHTELHTDSNYQWVIAIDPASGLRKRYTVHRIHRWTMKAAEIMGQEVDLKTARKIAGVKAPKVVPPSPKAAALGFDHHCDWREGALKLAKCVVATLQTNGKIGMGSGMVMKMVDGKRVIERWDKPFIEALNFIGLDVVPVKKARKKS